ncbi:MAG: hypothetical protein J6A73_08485 [Lachnospiraceae bacterium]|nr:hypothetical protein [Lachnospiraceae bacterium]
MYEILNFFKVCIDFAYNAMNISFNIYGVSFTMWEVMLFVLLGSILWGFINALFAWYTDD